MKQKLSIALEAQHLYKSITSGEDKLDILKDINFSVPAGESIAILGASGAGKTTLLTLLAGLDLPSSGEVFLEKHRLSIMNEDARATLRSQKIGFVFQSFQLLPELTALDNVILPLEIQGISLKTAKQSALECLNDVGLSSRLSHYPSQLSGGEQQRVAIARAFVTKPSIIFADEITGNLDQDTGEKVIDMLFHLNQKQKTTLIIVTHDAILAKHCHHNYLLNNASLDLI